MRRTARAPPRQTFAAGAEPPADAGPAGQQGDGRVLDDEGVHARLGHAAQDALHQVQVVIDQRRSLARFGALLDLVTRPDVDIVLAQLPQVCLTGVPEFNTKLPALAYQRDDDSSRVVTADTGQGFVEGVHTYDPAHLSATGEVRVVDYKTGPPWKRLPFISDKRDFIDAVKSRGQTLEDAGAAAPASMRRLEPAQPANDGRQTPWRGHPVFTAQHATATCCHRSAQISPSKSEMPCPGSLAVDSVLQRDVLTVQGIIVFTTLVVVAVNLLVDVTYAYFNPKLRTR